jgi:hypothetical protein
MRRVARSPPWPAEQVEHVLRIQPPAAGRVSHSFNRCCPALLRFVCSGSAARRARAALAGLAAGRAGEFATVDPTLATLLGREPITVDTVLREHLSKG